MVSQATIQAKVAYGYSRAARAAGAVCQFYRPSGAGPVVVSGNRTVAINALLDTNADMQQRVPSKAERPQDWYAGFDFSQAEPGDYLVDPALGTFAILSIESFRPARLVRCNRVLTVSRPGSPTPGPGYYGGDLTATETALLTSWPAGVVLGTKGEKSDVVVPGDTRTFWAAITLPPSVPVELRPDDVLLDDQSPAMRYTLSGVELTASGYRLTAAYAAP